MTEKDTKIDEEKPIPKDVQFFANEDSFKENCANKRLCLIGFLDGRVNEKSMKSFDDGIKTLEQLLQNEKSRQLSIGWVNATCHV